MIGGNRKQDDGICYVGSKKNSKPDKTGEKQILNDFVVK